MSIDVSFFSSLKKSLTSSRRCRLFVSTIAAIVLIGAGSVSYVVIDDYIDSRRDDYCLVFSEGDFGSVLDGITSTSDDDEGERRQSPDNWSCRIDGDNGQRLRIESTSNADFYFPKDPNLTRAEDRSMMPGSVVSDVPGSDALVASWTGDGYAAAGWFEGNSAIAIYTLESVESSQCEYTAEILTKVILRRAPALLSETGFTPTHTPTTTPEPASSPT
ncbi:hypothetical protein ACSL103130_04710 [Actinomyces slackii]|uniref:Uncharacterized protein n=1 Tax=Actinomyces slackii TaxID=52774 RepID=A0A448KDB5_9ACTO|nr:hypothetical protein [Actinomyces slackii]VEG74921.1 Uncharacterised protein [Actinomyces slackii]